MILVVSMILEDTLAPPTNVPLQGSGHVAANPETTMMTAVNPEERKEADGDQLNRGSVKEKKTGDNQEKIGGDQVISSHGK